MQHSHKSLSLFPKLIKGILFLLLYVNWLPTPGSWSIILFKKSSLRSLLFVKLKVALLLLTRVVSILLVIKSVCICTLILEVALSVESID
jgi:hypothetical protein